MAKVLILSLVFPPDHVSTAHLMGDLAEDLKLAGHDVMVITTFPHYGNDTRATCATIKTRYLFGLVGESVFRGVRVVHICIGKKARSIFLRALSWLWFHAASIFLAVCIGFRPQVLFVPSPPLSNGLAGHLIARWHRAVLIYNIQELYPDIAIHLGVLTNRFLIRIALRLEQFIYCRAARITVIGDGIKRRLLSKGVAVEKVEVIPNFVDISQFSPAIEDPEFDCVPDLRGKFIISYAGNVGRAQGLAVLVEAATILRQNNDIQFAIVGNGIDFDALRDESVRRGLCNMRFISYQPTRVIAQLYRSSALSVVALSEHIGDDAVPSKVYRIMASGCPVLAIVDADADLARLIEEARCGLRSPPAAPQELSQVILGAYADRLQLGEMGRRGYSFALRGYTRRVVGERYCQLVETLVRSN